MLSMSRRVRLCAIAGALATAGVAATLSIGTANAAGEAPNIVIDANQTRINSVQVITFTEDSNEVGTCVTGIPHDGGAKPAGLKAHPHPPGSVAITNPDGSHSVITYSNDVSIASFTTPDCTGTALHADGLGIPTGQTGDWVILLRTLDDDDTTPWTQ